MADINVVPKKRTSILVWLMVGDVAALIVWAIMSGSRTPMEPVSRVDVPAPGVVPLDVVPAPRG